MSKPLTRSVAVRVDHRSLDARKLVELPCRCGSPLSLHQPDAQRPALLLGACPECGDWFAIDASDEGATEVYRLPCLDELARAIRPSPPVDPKPRPGRRL